METFHLVHVNVRCTGSPVAHQVRTLRAILLPRSNASRILMPLMMVSGILVIAILVASSTTNGEEPEWAAELDVMELRWEQSGFNMSLDGPGIWDMELSPDFRYLAVSTLESCYIIDVENQTISRTISFPNLSMVDAAWSPDGRYLAVSNRNYISVIVYDTDTWEIVQTLEWHNAWDSDQYIYLDWNPNGSFLASSFQGALILWNTSTWEVHYFIYVPGIIHSIEWSPDGSMIAVVNHYGLAIVSFEDREIIKIEGYSRRTLRNFSGASWSPDGSLMVVSSYELYNPVAYIYDTNNYEVVKIIEGHNDLLADARWSSDGMVLVTTSVDDTLVFWNPSNWSIIQRCRLNESLGEIRWIADITRFYLEVGGYGHGNLTVREFQIPESELLNLKHIGTPTTGDSFQVEINVSSILPLRSATLIYRCPGNEWAMANMTYVRNDIFKETVMIPDRLGHLEFFVEVSDSYGRMTSSDIVTLPIHDNDPPVLGEDGSDAVGWSGHPFRFEATASDNIQVSTVEATYWIGEARASISLEPIGGAFCAHIDLPQFVGDLNYAFTVTDSSGLLSEGEVVSLDITDMDLPEISIEHPGTATTGDTFVVTCYLEDNIALSEAWMEWGIDELTDRQNIPLGGFNPLQTMVMVPHSIGTLNFVIKAQDTSGNENSTTKTTVEVVDNDAPYILEDLTERTAYTGRDQTITVSVGDNIAVSSVETKYSFDGGAIHEGVLERSSSNHVLSIRVPEDARILEYSLTVVDSSGNDNTTEKVIVPVLDVIAPTIGGSGKLSIRTSDPFTITVSGHDNRDPVNVTTHLRYPGGEWTERIVGAGIAFDLNFTSEELGATTNGFCGAIQFWVEAVDASGNAVSHGSVDDPNLITVMDEEPPTIRLHGPTRCVTGELVVFDADDSLDNVGIEKYTWTVEGPEVLSWNGPTVETSFTKSGDYVIHLVVTDDSGNKAARDYYVRVDDEPKFDSSRDQIVFIIVVLGVFLSTVALMVATRR